MRILKRVIGVVLILGALGAMVYWEAAGRQDAMTEEVLAAAQDIEEGQLIKAGMVKITAVLKENVIKGAMRPKDSRLIEGKIAGADISENQQLTKSCIKEQSHSMEKGCAPYTIKKEWIENISSSVRRGDWVGLYGEGQVFLGDFKVAFVKDSSNQEIVDVDAPLAEKDILERTSGSGALDHIEIEASLEGYRAILKCIEETGKGLLIVQKGE